KAQRRAWASVDLADRRAIVRELIKDFDRVAERWYERGRDAEGLPADMPQAAEEWLSGPYMVLRNLTLLDRALGEIERFGAPKVPGPVTERSDGTTVAQVFPTDGWDRLFYAGVTGEVWMQPGVTPSTLKETMAVAYRDDADRSGGCCLVLGAGNVSSIGPMDVLYKLFVEHKTTLLKMHPVNAYLGPLITEGFQALVDWGVLRVVYGGADVGQYLCEHDDVTEIHITGSDKTVDAIVFGAGAEGRDRKQKRRPRNTKPISSELGNVSPVIVVPGPWSAGDLAFQGENIASMLTNNAGFNCNAARVVVQHAGWKKRKPLLDQVRRVLRSTPTRYAYYPGAADRWAAFVDAHPGAEKLGRPRDSDLPWTLIPDGAVQEFGGVGGAE
ncbi:MAG: aldehyde dehydrogenase family protein, partial [Acidobacteriota bacterium]